MRFVLQSFGILHVVLIESAKNESNSCSFVDGTKCENVVVNAYGQSSKAEEQLLTQHSSLKDDTNAKGKSSSREKHQLTNDPSLEAEDQGNMWDRVRALLSNPREVIQKYTSAFDRDTAKDDQRQLTDQYYNLVTDFYEYGWGDSFHFASRFEGESLEESIARHEHWIALKLGLKAGQKVADLGMGVGGPLREIAKFSGAYITGVTINEYQVRRAKSITASKIGDNKVGKLMNYVHGDYTKLVPNIFPPNSLDAVYYIESAVHLSNRIPIWTEAAKALKPGGKVFIYDWVLTDRFDPQNPKHVEAKRNVEYGDAIGNLISYRTVLKSLVDTGFKILEHGDLTDIAEETYGTKNVPWYQVLDNSWSVRYFPQSCLGRSVLNKFLHALEFVGLLDSKTRETAAMLDVGAVGLVAGGKSKVFTPMYYILAEKS